MFVKPAANPAAKDDTSAFPFLQIFDPALGNYLPEEGREVGGDNNLYWQRRINDKDVSALNAEAAAKSMDAAERARAKLAADKAAADKAAEKAANPDANKEGK
jgi:hypothetical protein